MQLLLPLDVAIFNRWLLGPFLLTTVKEAGNLCTYFPSGVVVRTWYYVAIRWHESAIILHHDFWLTVVWNFELGDFNILATGH